MCKFCCVEVLLGTPLDIRNKVAGREQARSFLEPVSLHATATMILKGADVMRSEATAAEVAGGAMWLNKKKLMHDIYIKAQGGQDHQLRWLAGALSFLPPSSLSAVVPSPSIFSAWCPLRASHSHRDTQSRVSDTAMPLLLAFTACPP